MMIVRELLVPPYSLLPSSVLGGGGCVGGTDDSVELEDDAVEGSEVPPSVLGGGDCVGGDDDSEELEDVTVEGSEVPSSLRSIVSMHFI